jgi:hypothetical protein
MITSEYIASFKKTSSFDVISKGLLKGDLTDVIEGNGSYRITSNNEIENTVPSLVLITIHILVSEGSNGLIDVSDIFHDALITEYNVCLYLEYIKVFIKYKESHSEVEFDYKGMYRKIKSREPDFANLFCFNSRMKSLKNIICMETKL